MLANGLNADQPTLMWIKERKKRGDESGEFVLVFRQLSACVRERERDSMFYFFCFGFNLQGIN